MMAVSRSCRGFSVEHRPRSNDEEFRRLATARGIYYVVWDPEHVTRLLISERLMPDELLVSNPSEVQHLIRDLFLLAVGEEIRGTSSNGRRSVLARFAKTLFQLFTTKTLN